MPWPMMPVAIALPFAVDSAVVYLAPLEAEELDEVLAMESRDLVLARACRRLQAIRDGLHIEEAAQA